MDVLVDGFAAAHYAPRSTETRAILLELARGASRELRRRMRREVLMESLEDVAAGASWQPEDRERLWEWLDELLSHLPLRQRVAIERHHLDKVRDADIAAEIKCAVGSVPVLRARGMRRLRQIVENARPLE